ncbi:MAG: efflux RND transporter periplasmic adaptor subunit [Planctomycetota bacterium]
MIDPRVSLLLSLLVVAGACGTGCRPAAATVKPPAPPPEVIVATGVEKEFIPTEEFTGRLAASEEVDIRARVTGHLDDILFSDGATVRKGEPLFVIDPRTYESELTRVTATIGQSKARLDRIARQVERAKQLLASRAISSEEAELLEFDRAEAIAALRVAEANKELAELQVGFTTVKSPVDGRIGRHLIDAGNMVTADSTSLAHIVSLNPIYAYFVVDERTVLKFRRALAAGESFDTVKKKWALELALLDESETSIRGEIDFIDNELDADTGTLAIRATIPNDDLRLLPGFFVRCRMAMGEKRTGLCIPEEALVTDQGQRHLYVLNADDEVEYRRVTLGPLLEKLRVIESGLEPGERVVVAGQQRIRPGQKVAIAKE